MSVSVRVGREQLLQFEIFCATSGKLLFRQTFIAYFRQFILTEAQIGIELIIR